MMIRKQRCCVPGCEDTTAMRHRLPVFYPDRFRIWKKRIANPKFEGCSSDYLYQRYKICHLHFAEDCFSPGTKRLNHNSVPTLNLPGGNVSVCEPSDSNCVEDGNTQERFKQDAEHEKHSEGIITFIIVGAQQKLSDRNIRMFSPVKYINSLPWKIMLQRKDSYLGVFLCLHGTDYDPNYKVYCEFSFRLVDQANIHTSIVQVGHHEFRRGGTGHGFPRFAPTNNLLNPDGHFLINDTVVIHCRVACSSLLAVIDASTSEDVAIQSFMQVNNIPEDYLAIRAKHVLENGVGSDCEFIIDGSTTRKKASKAILALASPVFENMFFVNGKGCSNVFRVTDIQSSVFDVMLQHIYGVKWEFQSKVQASQLYYAACKYELKDLQIICIRFLWPNSLDDVWIALECAVRFKHEDLQEAAMKIVRKNASTAFETNQFLDISLDCLVLILKQTELNVSSEIIVFNAALQWASAMCKKKNLSVSGSNLRSVLGEAVRHIRFLSMTDVQFAGSPCESGLLTEQEMVDIFKRLSTKEETPLFRELCAIRSPRSA